MSMSVNSQVRAPRSMVPGTTEPPPGPLACLLGWYLGIPYSEVSLELLLDKNVNFEGICGCPITQRPEKKQKLLGDDMDSLPVCLALFHFILGYRKLFLTV